MGIFQSYAKLPPGAIGHHWIRWGMSPPRKRHAGGVPVEDALQLGPTELAAKVALRLQPGHRKFNKEIGIEAARIKLRQSFYY